MLETFGVVVAAILFTNLLRGAVLHGVVFPLERRRMQRIARDVTRQMNAEGIPGALEFAPDPDPEIQAQVDAGKREGKCTPIKPWHAFRRVPGERPGEIG